MDGDDNKLMTDVPTMSLVAPRSLPHLLWARPPPHHGDTPSPLPLGRLQLRLPFFFSLFFFCFLGIYSSQRAPALNFGRPTYLTGRTLRGSVPGQGPLGGSASLFPPSPLPPPPPTPSFCPSPPLCRYRRFSPLFCAVLWVVFFFNLAAARFAGGAGRCGCGCGAAFLCRGGASAAAWRWRCSAGVVRQRCGSAAAPASCCSLARPSQRHARAASAPGGGHCGCRAAFALRRGASAAALRLPCSAALVLRPRVFAAAPTRIALPPCVCVAGQHSGCSASLRGAAIAVQPVQQLQWLRRSGCSGCSAAVVAVAVVAVQQLQCSGHSAAVAVQWLQQLQCGVAVQWLQQL